MRYISFLFLITCLIHTPYWGYAEGKISFTDITAAAGLQFHHVDGRSGERYFLETVGSGAAFFDYDGDGWIDIYFVNGADLPGFRSPQSPTNVLYRNNGDSTFTDVTQHAGVEDRRWSLGCAFADYDNDGFVDLYVTNYIDFHFETHTNCTQKGVAAYCPPESFEGAPDTLYRNNGDGTFTDVTTIAGVYNEGGKGMGVVFGDYDNDGDTDCYVGNDAGENFLYQNRGDGTFTNVGWMAGVEADENGNVQGTMGVDFGDYDNDGLLDLIAINYQQQPNALYRNDNAHFFTDVSFVAGMADSVPYVGWGVDFFDVDNDGDKDLLIANGHLQDTIEQYDDTTTYPQHNHLLINNGQGYFVNESVKTGNGLQSRKVSRGLATGDYDNDGDLDVLICNANDIPQLLRNDSEMQENWILIHTVGTRSNRAGIGTRVKIQTDTLIQIDEVRGGSGYLSQNDLRLHFGIGAHKHIDRIEARWPSGIVDIIRDVAPNQIITITEGTHVR
jgi:hypothetical protein